MLIPALVAIAVYAGSLRGGFVYDDYPLVVENPLVNQPVSAAKLLASPYWPGFRSNYRPLTVASFAANARISGMEPWPFHAVNVVLHAANAALVGLLAAALGLAAAPAAFCGAAFAALPVHAEAVDWVVGRSELLAAFFGLLAWLTLLRCRSAFRALAGLAFFGLALLSKESAAALPAAFVLSELAVSGEPLARTAKRRAPIWAALFGVLGLYLEWRRLILGAAIAPEAPYFARAGAATVVLTMSRFFAGHWIGSLATGRGLCVEYWRPDFPDAGLSDVGAWLALAGALCVAGWAAWEFLRRRSLRSFCALAFLALAAPLLNVIVPLPILGADRLMYLPSVAFCLLLGAAWPSGALARRRAAAAACAALAWWSWASWSRHAVWASNDALWSATIRCAPRSPRALTSLGLLDDAKGRHAEARSYYERALAAQPDFEHAAFAEASSFHQEGRDAEAEQRVLAMMRRDPPGPPSVWCLLGVIREAQRRPGQAALAYRNALKLDPSYRLARRDLGLLLYRAGRPQDGERELRAFLALDPGEADAREIRAFLARNDFAKIRPE